MQEWLIEPFNQTKKLFVGYVHVLGMFKDKTKSPTGQGFTLKLHKTKPDAPLSPFYIDLRLVRSFPNTAKKAAVELFQDMMDEYFCDLLADIPTSITAVVSTLSDCTGIPMVTPRPSKDHGAGGGVEGVFEKGQTALLFDDLITEAHSKIEAAEILRANGIVVKHVFVLVDREQGGAEELAKHGLTLHAALTLTEMLEMYRADGNMDPALFEEIQAYRAAAAAQKA